MYEIEFELLGDRIEARALLEALKEFLHLLEAVDKSAFSNRKTVRWRLKTLRYSSPAAIGVVGESRKQNKPNNAPIVGATIHSGIHDLTEKRRPKNFSDDALEASKALADLSGQFGVRGVNLGIRNGHASETLLVGSVVSEYVTELIGPSQESLGSIEGRLELVGASKGNIYGRIHERSTGKPVRFEVSRDAKAKVLGLFDSDVIADGVIQRDSAGQARRIAIHEVRPATEGKELPRSLLGIDPGFTDGEDSSDWLRKRWQ